VCACACATWKIFKIHTYIVTYLGVCDYRRSMDWILDLLTTCTHYSRTTSNYSAIANLHSLKITTAPAKPFPTYYVFNSHSLATASNSGDSLVSRTVITVWRISRNWTLVNCQLNYSAISFQPSLQNFSQLPTLQLNSLTHQPITSLFFTQLNCTQPAWDPRYVASGQTQQKTPSPTVPLLQLPSDSLDIVHMFTGCYRAMHIPFRKCCIATVLRSGGLKYRCFVPH
jgi:hypothetical protein